MTSIAKSAWTASKEFEVGYIAMCIQDLISKDKHIVLGHIFQSKVTTKKNKTKQKQRQNVHEQGLQARLW